MNDNNPPPPAGHLVPVIGYVAGDGQVTITDPSWRPTPTTGAADLFPNDTREA